MSCPTGKRIFLTRVDARAMRKHYPGAPRRAYPCDLCGGWHLGRLTRTAKHGGEQAEVRT